MPDDIIFTQEEIPAESYKQKKLFNKDFGLSLFRSATTKRGKVNSGQSDQDANNAFVVEHDHKIPDDELLDRAFQHTALRTSTNSAGAAASAFIINPKTQKVSWRNYGDSPVVSIFKDNKTGEYVFVELSQDHNTSKGKRQGDVNMYACMGDIQAAHSHRHSHDDTEQKDYKVTDNSPNIEGLDKVNGTFAMAEYAQRNGFEPCGVMALSDGFFPSGVDAATLAKLVNQAKKKYSDKFNKGLEFSQEIALALQLVVSDDYPKSIAAEEIRKGIEQEFESFQNDFNEHLEPLGNRIEEEVIDDAILRDQFGDSLIDQLNEAAEYAPEWVQQTKQRLSNLGEFVFQNDTEKEKFKESFQKFAEGLKEILGHQEMYSKINTYGFADFDDCTATIKGMPKKDEKPVICITVDGHDQAGASTSRAVVSTLKDVINQPLEPLNTLAAMQYELSMSWDNARISMVNEALHALYFAENGTSLPNNKSKLGKKLKKFLSTEETNKNFVDDDKSVASDDDLESIASDAGEAPHPNYPKDAEEVYDKLVDEIVTNKNLFDELRCLTMSEVAKEQARAVKTIEKRGDIEPEKAKQMQTALNNVSKLLSGEKGGLALLIAGANKENYKGSDESTNSTSPQRFMDYMAQIQEIYTLYFYVQDPSEAIHFGIGVDEYSNLKLLVAELTTILNDQELTANLKKGYGGDRNHFYLVNQRVETLAEKLSNDPFKTLMQNLGFAQPEAIIESFKAEVASCDVDKRAEIVGKYLLKCSKYPDEASSMRETIWQHLEDSKINPAELSFEDALSAEQKQHYETKQDSVLAGTLMHLAAYHGDIVLMDFLETKDMDQNQLNGEGFRPIDYLVNHAFRTQDASALIQFVGVEHLNVERNISEHKKGTLLDVVLDLAIHSKHKGVYPEGVTEKGIASVIEQLVDRGAKLQKLKPAYKMTEKVCSYLNGANPENVNLTNTHPPLYEKLIELTPKLLGIDTESATPYKDAAEAVGKMHKFKNLATLLNVKSITNGEVVEGGNTIPPRQRGTQLRTPPI